MDITESMKASMKRSYLLILFIVVTFLCLGINSTCNYSLGQDGLSLRIVRVPIPSLNLEDPVGELEHFSTRNGEWLLGAIRDFILDNPTSDNHKFFKGLKGQQHDDAVSEVLALLISKAKDYPERLSNLTYALRYLYLEGFAGEFLQKAKQISQEKDISPDFVTSYIDNEVIIATQTILPILNESQGRSMSLETIRQQPDSTYIAIMDVDNLTLLNRTYGKSILNYVLGNIRRTVSVILGQFSADAIVYTGLGRDELFITLSEVEDEAQAREILTLINETIALKNYAVIRLDSSTNSSISSLSSDEFDSLKQALSDRSVDISDGSYINGEYLLLLPLSVHERFINRSNAQGFLTEFLPDLNNHLKNSGIDINIEGEVFEFNRSLLAKATVSLGFSQVSLSEVDGDEAIYNMASEKANIALRDAKSSGKNTVVMYDESMQEHEDTNVIFNQELLQKIGVASNSSSIPAEDQDTLYPAIYNQETFRRIIQTSISEGGNGWLIWISPSYYIQGSDTPSRFKEINNLYGLEGGDLVIKALSHLLVESIPETLKNQALLANSRMSPDRLMIYLPSDNSQFGEHERVMVTDIIDTLKQGFDVDSNDLDVRFDVAVAGTHNIMHLGELFQNASYTLDSVIGAEIYVSDSGSIKIYTPAVDEEIVDIQRRAQEEAFRNLYNIVDIEEFYGEGIFNIFARDGYYINPRLSDNYIPDDVRMVSFDWSTLSMRNAKVGTQKLLEAFHNRGIEMVIVSEGADRDSIMAKLQEWGWDHFFDGSHSNIWQVAPRGMYQVGGVDTALLTKAGRVEVIAEAYGISNAQIVHFDDDPNCIEKFQYHGIFAIGVTGIIGVTGDWTTSARDVDLMLDTAYVFIHDTGIGVNKIIKDILNMEYPD